MRKPKEVTYSFLIICEGENTEPSFFNSIKDRIIDGIYQLSWLENKNVSITIKPEPKEDAVAKTLTISNHKPIRQPRRLNKSDGIIDNENNPLPLKFVNEGQKELEDKTFDEVWAVFDHDNHPARKEAFEKAKKIISGKVVKIAFSSIAFEYYLILHFERIHKAFLKSECRGSRKENNREIYYCGTNVHTNDCVGKNCVGGYARTKKYWHVTKDRNYPIFPLIEGRLKIGFINSAWLRFISKKQDIKLANYERNPFVTTDTLVKRLTGNDIYDYEWVSEAEKFVVGNFEIAVNSRSFTIENKSSAIQIIPEKIFNLLDSVNYESIESFGEKIIIHAKEKVSIDIPNVKNINPNVLQIEIEQTRILFSVL